MALTSQDGLRGLREFHGGKLTGNKNDLSIFKGNYERHGYMLRR